MTSYRVYPCSSGVKTDALHVWRAGDSTDEFGFQTPGGSTAILNAEQVRNLVKILTGKEEIGSVPKPISWYDEQR